MFLIFTVVIWLPTMSCESLVSYSDGFLIKGTPRIYIYIYTYLDACIYLYKSYRFPPRSQGFCPVCLYESVPFVCLVFLNFNSRPPTATLEDNSLEDLSQLPSHAYVMVGADQAALCSVLWDAIALPTNNQPQGFFHGAFYAGPL